MPFSGQNLSASSQRRESQRQSQPADPWDECAEIERLYRSRHYDLKLPQRRMINLRLQWETESDLVDIDQEVRVNLDYDLKREPVEPVNKNGVVRFTTRPWRTIEDFHEHRDAFEIWRKKKKRVLLSASDWTDFLAYKRDAAARAEAGVRASNRPPVVQMFLRCYAHGLAGLPGNRYGDVAKLITDFGWPTTVQNVKDAKRRGQPRERAISQINDKEREFLEEAKRRWPGFESAALLKAEIDPFAEEAE